MKLTYLMIIVAFSFLICGCVSKTEVKEPSTIALAEVQKVSEEDVTSFEKDLAEIESLTQEIEEVSFDLEEIQAL